MRQDDPESLAEELEAETDALQKRSDELQGRVEDARQDWERKRADASVPGAVPPQGEEDDASEHDARPDEAGEERSA